MMKHKNWFLLTPAGLFRKQAFFCIAFVFAAAASVLAQQPHEQQGIATWYETDSPGLTASSPVLPVGTRLRITNLNNNRQVVVVVDGRISYNEGRLLDISKEAARNLDMLEGPAPVRMEILTASQAAASEDQPELAEQEPPGENELVPLPELAQTFEPESEAAFEPEPAAPPAAATPPPVITMEPAPMTPPPALPPSETPPPQPGRTRADAEASNMTIKLIVNINGKEQALNLSSQDASVEFDTLPCDIAAPQPAVSVKIIPAAPDPRSAGFYRLQVGAFASLSLAQGVYLRLKNAGFSPALELNGKFYRVVIAGVKAQDISATARRLGDAGFAEAWVRKER